MGGRHSDPDRGAFWRSLALAVGKGVLVLGLLGAATAVVVTYTSGGDPTTDGPALVQPDDGSPLTARATPTPPGETSGSVETPGPTAGPTPGPTAEPTPEPTPEPTLEPTATPAPTATPTVSVQVLDTGAGREAALEVAELLESWGYDVVAVNDALCCRDVTTVLYSAGRDAEAAALAEREPRFAAVEETSRLDQSVDLHVAVGRDWES